MGNRWQAQVGTDPSARAREIGRTHSAFLAGRPVPGDRLREVVAQSWRRSARAAVNPDAEAPIALADADLAAYRDQHPLASVLGLFQDLVGSAASAGRHLMAVADASGQLLWVEGHAGARARAERMNFVAGALWDEAHAGTNAPGTALATDHEVQIFATEHFRHPVQGWTCAAAPVHDPATRELLGIIDVTGGPVVAHPHSLALVRAAARAAESQLAQRHTLWVPRPPAVLRVLGAAEGRLRRDGRDHALPCRLTEILFLLARHPDGRSGDELAAGLYTGPAGAGAVRVELTRLRQLVGDLLRSRPYRLAEPVTSDFDAVADALRRGDVAGAVAGYTGPLLPPSEAPEIVADREWLDAAVRSAVMASGRIDALRGWVDRAGFDDLAAWEALTTMLPRGTRRAVAASRVRRLRADYGLAP